MATNFLSGKTGTVTVATAASVSYTSGGTVSSVVGASVAIAFGEWRMDIESKTIKIPNFVTAPYEISVPGLIGATAESDMPGYDQGNTPLVAGNYYQVFFGWTASLGITVTCILKKLSPANKADGVPTIKASWEVTGAFAGSVS